MKQKDLETLSGSSEINVDGPGQPYPKEIDGMSNEENVDVEEWERLANDVGTKSKGKDALEDMNVWDCVGNMLWCAIIGGAVMSFVGYLIDELFFLSDDYFVVYAFLCLGLTIGFFSGLFKSILDAMRLLKKEFGRK